MGAEREGMIKKEGLQSSVVSVILKIIQFINIGDEGRNQNLRSECWIWNICGHESQEDVHVWISKRDLDWSNWVPLWA